MRITTDDRPRLMAGFVSGLVGGLVMVLAQGIARLSVGLPMFPDLFEDLATKTIPAPLFSFALATLKFGAKPLLFAGLLAVQIVVGGLVGLIFALIWGRSAVPGQRWAGWRGGIVLGLAVWAITAVLLLPLAGQGMFGSGTTDGPFALNLVLILGFLLFGVTLAASYAVLAFESVPLSSPDDAAVVRSPERRRILGGVAVGAVAVLTAGTTYRIVHPPSPDVSLASATAAGGARPATPSAEAAAAAGSVSGASSVATATTASATNSSATAVPGTTPAVASANPTSTAAGTTGAWNVKGLSREVTPTSDFYTVSKNFFSDPTVDPSHWTLQVAGEVKNPYTMTYNKLLQLPAIERHQTLMCISNEVGGDLISNALWKGTSLRDIIMTAQPAANVVKVVFTASDGYQDSVTLDRAMSAQNVLAHTMNGEALNAKHGMPARLLIPGIYGMKNVKWITKIELLTADFKGYWQTRGWNDEAYINTMSRIDTPSIDNGKYPAGPLDIAGVAFGGESGISKVGISVDGGKTWNDTVLKEPLGTFTWRLWRYTWAATPGNHTLMVRATNGKGELQAIARTDTFPNGATGWHAISVNIT